MAEVIRTITTELQRPPRRSRMPIVWFAKMQWRPNLILVGTGPTEAEAVLNVAVKLEAAWKEYRQDHTK